MSGYSATAAAAPLHPVHAMLLAFPLALFTAALLSDIAYARSYHVQWANFASWLIAGGVLTGIPVLLWALVGVFRRADPGWTAGIYFAVVLAMWVAGFINALVHSRDAWGAMPQGLYLSVITALLAVIAAWMGYSRPWSRLVP